MENHIDRRSEGGLEWNRRASVRAASQRRPASEGAARAWGSPETGKASVWTRGSHGRRLAGGFTGGWRSRKHGRRFSRRRLEAEEAKRGFGGWAKLRSDRSSRGGAEIGQKTPLAGGGADGEGLSTKAVRWRWAPTVPWEAQRQWGGAAGGRGRVGGLAKREEGDRGFFRGFGFGEGSGRREQSILAVGFVGLGSLRGLRGIKSVGEEGSLVKERNGKIRILIEED